jgi:hypothetical protein
VSFEILAFVRTILELSEDRGDRLNVELNVGGGWEYKLCFVVIIGFLSKAMGLYFELFEAAIILHVIY